MGRATRAAVMAVCCALALLMTNTRASAQAQPKIPTLQDEWRFKITPYFWFAGLTGDVGVGPLQTNTDLGFSDIWRALNFATMVSGEAHKGPWIIAADVIYLNLGDARVVAVRGDTGQVSLGLREWIVQPQVGYTLGDQTFGVDLLGSGRFWSLRTDLNIDRPNGVSIDRNKTRTWGDPVGGIRAHAMLPQYRVRLVGYIDGGGAAYSGSHSTWQAYATVGYDIAPNWTVSGGYRSLSVNYQPDNFLNHTRMRGWLASATFSF